MAHLKNPETGTEIEVDDDTAKVHVSEGWKAVTGDGGTGGSDHAGGRRKPSRKAASA